jgi:hypothetical protein
MYPRALIHTCIPNALISTTERQRRTMTTPHTATTLCGTWSSALSVSTTRSAPNNRAAMPATPVPALHRDRSRWHRIHNKLFHDNRYRLVRMHDGRAKRSQVWGTHQSLPCPVQYSTVQCSAVYRSKVQLSNPDTGSRTLEVQSTAHAPTNKPRQGTPAHNPSTQPARQHTLAPTLSSPPPILGSHTERLQGTGQSATHTCRSHHLFPIRSDVV